MLINTFVLSTMLIKNNASHHRNMCKGFRHKVIYSCDSCSKQFLYKSKLEEHAKMHSRESCNCDKCGKMYKRKDHLLKYASKCEGFQFTAENNDFQPTMDSILYNLETVESQPTVTGENSVIAVSQGINSSLLAELSNLNTEANNTNDDFQTVPVLEESVTDSTLLTLPRKKQNRNAKRRER